ncbi:hypothetical protein WEH80_35115 [Actinomycetes bacterium KLBMP 9759]
MHLIVDAANVIGSRPDGWWRDRQGAARRLAGSLVAVLSTDPAVLVTALGREPVGPLLVHLVLEGAAGRTPDLPTHPALDVVVAPADGDSTIAALAADLHEEQVVVVTADRALRERVRVHGATAVGPAVLLGALPAGS